ncbi:hypothetical protein BD410DRAFT_792395 [Rickenella mellea]|uniref:Uncharacterized protein n=1 Tax=Rickenella mellea TaxID=50990 RepID=A0A4Y7PW50_9AGAM|nr:hypothetical protein BD410DRAFT_792395 [Rickenella mellea]
MFFIRTTLHSRRLEIVNDPPILRGLVVRDTAGTPPSSPSVVTFASASPAATSGVSNGLSPLGTSSMYPTLGVILAIAIAMLSGAFVSRSRRRREIDEAMRNGSYVVMNRNNEGVVMQKPMIYDAFVMDHDYHSMMNRSGKWEDIVPVSAGLLTRSSAEGRSEVHIRSRDRSRPQAGLANDTHNSNSPPVHTSPTTMKVSVLIAMPSPHPLPRSTPYGKAKMVELDDSDRSMSEFSFEEHDLDLPMVEFGIVEVPVVRNARMDPGRRLSETTSESITLRHHQMIPKFMNLVLHLNETQPHVSISPPA